MTDEMPSTFKSTVLVTRYSSDTHASCAGEFRPQVRYIRMCTHRYEVGVQQDKTGSVAVVAPATGELIGNAAGVGRLAAMRLEKNGADARWI